MFLQLFLFGQTQKRFSRAGRKRSDPFFMLESLSRFKPDHGGIAIQKVLPNAAPASLVLSLPRTAIRAELDPSNILRFSCHGGCLPHHHRIFVALWWHFCTRNPATACKPLQGAILVNICK